MAPISRKIFSLLMVITIIFMASTFLAEKGSSTSEIEEKLNSISEEEKEILEYLFVQVQEIEEMEREQKKINEEIGIMEKDIETIEARIKKQEVDYEKNLVALEKVLKSYQRMGPGSYLEIVLSSDSLASLIKRINILRDLTKNTGEILDTIDINKKDLVLEKTNLDEKLHLLEEKTRILEESLTKKQELVKEKEVYLASLAGDRELYVERLEYIDLMMDEVKKILADFTLGFGKIIEEGRFPQDAVKETITLRGIKGTIEEKVFNQIINHYEWMPKVEIKFYPDVIELNAPEKSLVLKGRFIVVEGQILKFEPDEGSFYGMPLEKGTIVQLFEEGDFILNLEPLIGKNILRTVEIKEGYMEILVALKLF